MMRPIAAALWYRVGCFVFAGGTHRRGLCGGRWTGDTAWRRVSPARRAPPAATDEDRMRDQRIVTLMILIFILNVGHTIDHVARGAVRWPLTADSVAFIVVSAIIYALIGLVLYLYWYGKVGPRFIAIVAALGTAFGWFGHFSSFTDQPPQHILHAYQSMAVGWLAVGWLIALMLALIVTTIYATRLWLTQRQAQAGG